MWEAIHVACGDGKGSEGTEPKRRALVTWCGTRRAVQLSRRRAVARGCGKPAARDDDERKCARGLVGYAYRQHMVRADSPAHDWVRRARLD
jgi:hypothetical protein